MINDGGPAYPSWDVPGELDGPVTRGMSLRDYFAAAALSNPALCTGQAQDYEIRAWFGKDACGITRAQIVERQAHDYADAMMKVRKRP